MRRISRVFVPAILAGLFLTVAAAPVALAADSGLGKNLGEELSGIVEPLLISVAALVGLPAMFKRDLSQAIIIFIMVLVLGGFVFATDEVKSAVDAFWGALGK